MNNSVRLRELMKDFFFVQVGIGGGVYKLFPYFVVFFFNKFLMKEIQNEFSNSLQDYL